MKLKTNIGLSLLALFLLGLCFFNTRPGAVLNSVFPTSEKNLVGLSIGISHNHFGLDGLRGYMKIQQLFIDKFQIKQNLYGIATYEQVNEIIKDAVNLPHPESAGIHYSFGINAGIGWLAEIAFAAFGMRSESWYYLSFFLLSLSVAAFLGAFQRNNHALFVLVLFLAAFNVIAMCAAEATPDLQVMFNERFLPAFCLLPTLHLLFVTFTRGGGQSMLLQGPLVLLQLIVMNLCISARTTGAIYPVGFLGIFLIALAWRKRLKLQLVYYPAITTVLFSLLFFLVMGRTMDPFYSQAGEAAAHGFWTPAYLGLGAHPEAKKTHGILYSDIVAFELVEKKAPEYGYTFHLKDQIGWGSPVNTGNLPKDPKEVMIHGSHYERILRDEFFRVLKNDPFFVLTAYLYKIPLFFSVYYNDDGAKQYHLGASSYLLYIPILLCLVAALFFYQKEMSSHSWRLYFAAIAGIFLWSMITPIFVIPEAYLIADSGVAFTMVLYAVALWGISIFDHTRKSRGIRESGLRD